MISNTHESDNESGALKRCGIFTKLFAASFRRRSAALTVPFQGFQIKC